MPRTATVYFRENKTNTKKRKTHSTPITENRKNVTNKTSSEVNGDTFLNPDIFAQRSGMENFIQNDEYSYTSFIPYLSRVQYDLMKNAHKNKKSKWNVLQNLRDHLLIEIEKRISHLWTRKPIGRGARDFKDDSNVDFPSNESALITIGFLTFAVFLIKLVMHLIQAVGTTPITTVTTGRKRRDVNDEEILKILQHVEQFTLK
ncbi:hypothetical protein RI129_000664 [Pyrocoelia pectoralis]|uniref:Uncharacterized protein n=1 Tax=Pyrocoelia pectoralis TaxID=417401 RepID=A0AAN7VKR0_9COLE